MINDFSRGDHQIWNETQHLGECTQLKLDETNLPKTIYSRFAARTIMDISDHIQARFVPLNFSAKCTHR